MFYMIDGHGKNHYLLYFTKYLGNRNIIKAIKIGLEQRTVAGNFVWHFEFKGVNHDIVRSMVLCEKWSYSLNGYASNMRQ